VGHAGVSFGRGRPADDGTQHDHRRAVGFGARGVDRVEQRVDVLDVVAGGAPVDGLGVPSVGVVPGGDVLAERHVGVVLDRDAVGVVERDQVAQPLVAEEPDLGEHHGQQRRDHELPPRVAEQCERHYAGSGQCPRQDDLPQVVPASAVHQTGRLHQPGQAREVTSTRRIVGRTRQFENGHVRKTPGALTDMLTMSPGSGTTALPP
jgi:hypothetical protein